MGEKKCNTLSVISSNYDPQNREGRTADVIHLVFGIRKTSRNDRTTACSSARAQSVKIHNAYINIMASLTINAQAHVGSCNTTIYTICASEAFST